ncbi:hypothetical protein LTR62_004060 [Meristemomyces frigidus]|uniref:endo-1,4-beta-xylanase n=1 Tax=Meristemomyces frigidus TaxID=1508187 RepID=A0AAN7TID0_9PEZI|nr:hypothetical protein LTR62_004060 [Meristemomyces frigidus]
MLFFTTTFVAATAALGAFAAPANVVKRANSPNSSGMNNGFYYQFWDDGTAGTTTYTNKAAGEYSVQWTNVGDMTSGKGWQTATPRNISFSGSVTANGNFYLAVYTWSQSGENYILENFGSYNPCNDGTTVGSITSDGSTYQICTVNRGNNYIQNWSIRQNKRSSGIVTTANHYNAYAAHGLTHNPLSAAAYQIVSTEGFGSTGSADITVSDAGAGTGSTAPTSSSPPASPTSSTASPTRATSSTATASTPTAPGGSCSALYGQCGDYIFTFPDTNTSTASGYGWEVNRESHEFVTVNCEGVCPVPVSYWSDGRTRLPQYQKQCQSESVPADTDSEADGLAAAAGALTLQSRQQTDEEILEELHEDPDYRLTCYFAHCCLRETRKLAFLCGQYPKDNLVGSVDEEGNTGTILAAAEENGLRTLRWLQDHGDSITQENHYGRTPLTKAALWGRLDTVQFLTGQTQ